MSRKLGFACETEYLNSRFSPTYPVICRLQCETIKSHYLVLSNSDIICCSCSSWCSGSGDVLPGCTGRKSGNRIDSAP